MEYPIPFTPSKPQFYKRSNSAVVASDSQKVSLVDCLDHNPLATAAQLGRLSIEENPMTYVRILHPIEMIHYSYATVVRVGTFGLVLKLADGRLSRYWPLDSVEVVK